MDATRRIYGGASIPPPREAGKPVPEAAGGKSFEEVLVGQLKLSRHAEERIRRDAVRLTPGDWLRIGQAVEKAAGKGARDSLILLRDTAFVVSVENRTVITAVSGHRMKENVFTGIDSAVIV